MSVTQYKVGDRVTVSLSAGRVVDGVVKAIINRTECVRLQVEWEGQDGTRLFVAGEAGQKLVRTFRLFLLT